MSTWPSLFYKQGIGYFSWILAFLFRSFGLLVPKGFLCHFAFQSFDFECTWWWLFQKCVVPIFWLWVYLMMVIPEVCRANLLILSVPDDGYSRSVSCQSFDFECTWWWLFQKCVVPIFWLWVYLMMVIPEVCRANLLILSVPDDGYSRSVSCQSFDFECTWWWLFQKCVVPIFWFWVYLMMVIPEVCRANLLTFECTWWWLFQKCVVPIFWLWVYLMMVIPEVCRANLLTLSVPDDGYSRSVSCQSFDFECTWWWLFQKCVVPIFWLWVYLMMVIPEVCHANLLTLSVPDDGYSRSVSCQSFDFECTWWWLFQKCVVPIFWLWVYLMLVIPEVCRANLLILSVPDDGYSRSVSCQSFDFECTWWWLFQKCVVPIFWLWVYLMMVIPEVCHANLLTLSVPDDGYSRSVSCQSFDFECTWWWLFQKCVVPIFWLWVYLMMVIPEVCRANLLILSVPDDGYSRSVSCQSFDFECTWWWLFQKCVVPIFWLWVYLMMVIPEVCRAHTQLDIYVFTEMLWNLQVETNITWFFFILWWLDSKIK